jgi:O-phosphoseryl-tRNA(Cys) synthetase
VQEEARRHTQSLILKPKKERSQFSTVAEGVVGHCFLLATMQAQKPTVSTLWACRAAYAQRMSIGVQSRSIHDLREFIAANKRDYLSTGKQQLANCCMPCSHSVGVSD